MAIEKKDISFSNLDSMELAIKSNDQLESRINHIEKTYHTINVRVAMKNLANVGEVLKLAYAGSKGFPCSKNTIEILSKYQSMIKNSYIASASFVEACLSALKYHKMAIIMAEKDKIESSWKMIEKCSELANRMAKKSEELVIEAKCLCDLSEKALTEAQNDENVSNEEKKQIKKILDESAARQAQLDAKTKLLYQQIQELKEQEADAAKKADEERGKQFALKLVTAIVAPIAKIAEAATKASTGSGIADAFSSIGQIASKNSNQVDELIQERKRMNNRLVDIQNELNKLKQENKEENNKKIQDLESENKQINENLKNLSSNESQDKSLDEKEMQIRKMKFELQKEEVEANAEIAKLGEMIKNLKQNENDLTASIYSLQLAIKALGKIKTTFEHTRQFWEGVEKHCKNLADTSILKTLTTDSVFKDDLIDELKNSGLSWLTLGKINYNATLTIKEVDQKTDNILNDLPTKSEALAIVQNEADTILKSLQNEESSF